MASSRTVTMLPGQGDLQMRDWDAADRAASRRLTEMTSQDLLDEGICPECCGDGCDTCEHEGRAGQCAECDAIVPASTMGSFCCESCNGELPINAPLVCYANARSEKEVLGKLTTYREQTDADYWRTGQQTYRITIELVDDGSKDGQ